MRTLKKALSLVLVLAMVLSLGVSAFAVEKAADYSDYADVKNTEAVDVLTAIGVLNGNDDGTFGPEGNFTRAAAAKIIAYMTLGKTVADALPATATQFSDVPATHWASKYIQYCVDEGIIGGNGDGTFAPEGVLTAAAWSKMLLCALGYDAKVEGLTGTGWEIAATRLAMKAGVASAEELAGTFNRDAAAKLAFNTLTADMVEYETTGTSIVIGDTTVNTGASKAKAVENKTSDYAGKLGTGTGENQTMQFCEQHFPNLLRTTGTDDAFNRPADHRWYINNDKVVGYNAAKDTVAHNAMKAASFTATITAKTAKADVVATVTGGAGADDDAKKAELAKNVNAILGLTKTAEKLTYDGVMTVNGGVDVAWADTDFLAGDEVEVYVDTNNVIKNIVITRYELAVVKSVTALTAAQIKANANNSDKDVVNATSNVVLTVASNVGGGDLAAIYNTRIAGFDYAKGDYVLVALNSGNTKVLASKAATTVEGTVAATKNLTYSIGGTYYGIATDKLGTVNAPANGTEGKWVLDAAGKLAAVVDTTAKSSDYAYVYRFVESSAAGSDGYAGASYTVYAVLSDGSKVSYPVALDSTNTYVKGDAAGATFGALNSNKNDSSVEAVVAYTINAKGQFEVVGGTETVTKTASTGAKVDKTNAVVVTGKYATNDTKFVFVDNNTGTKKLTVSTAVGYKSVNIAAGSTVTTVTNAAGAASIIFVKGVASALDGTASATLAVLLDATPVVTGISGSTTDPLTYTYSVIVDGKETTLTQSEANGSITWGTIVAGDVFYYTLNSAGKASVTEVAAQTVTAVMDANSIQTSTTGAIDLTNVTLYTLTKDTTATPTAYSVTEGATFSATSGADGNDVVVYSVNGTVKVVFAVVTIA